MNPASAFEQYRRMNVVTADQKTLIVMLYDGAIRFLGRAEVALNDSRIEEASNNLLRAQDILMELIAGINREAGEIAEGLLQLYSYMCRRLMEGNSTKTAEPLREVIMLLSQLKEAWVQIEVKQTGPNTEAMICG